MALTPEQVRQFHDRGVIVLKGFFRPDEVETVSAWLQTLQTVAQIGGEDARYYEKSPTTGEALLVRVEHFLGEHNAQITEVLLPGRVIECLGQLFGEPPVLFKEKVNYKLPGCRADKLHQDQAAGWNAYADFFITMALIIDANRKDNAALTFMTSGHYEKRLMTAEWEPLSHDDPPYLPAGEYQLIEADPGDVLFFDSYVPHGSPANSTSRSRRNIYITFNRRSAGDMRRRYYADKWASYPPNNLADARDSATYQV
jgi:hypothetical protein